MADQRPILRPSPDAGALPTDHRAADIAVGRQVLKTEADALAAAAESLGDEFSRAVDLLLAARGRVIVSGIGKSGHIARKIASTFASTGTPAHFVHPAEASHGDLGMITNADCLLMLSNSGEAKELSDMLFHARRFSIPMIAITSRPQSTLAKEASVALVLPPAPEACPMGLAPTTSSTLSLAYGDALAVALMERRGFNRDNYRELHPGGSLGRSLLRVRDIMHRDAEMPIVRLEARMKEVLLVMTSKGFGCAGVVDDEGRLAGIITDGDLRRHMSERLIEAAAREVMTVSPKTIREDALVAEAVATLNGAAGKPITCLFVTESGEDGTKPIGIIHIHDCLRAGVR